MILNIKISNVGGIKDSINLNFLANKKDKKNINSVFKLPGDIWVNRIIGIIAGNAHGKTTILNALASIGSFIQLPLRKKNIPTISEFELDAYKEEYRERIFKNMIDDFTSLDLITCNKLNNNNNSIIELELYINSDEESTTGFYKYYLEYNDTYKKSGIVKEKLCFKSSYTKKYNAIFEICNGFESEIGYKIAYEKNIVEELKSNHITTDEFYKKIKFYKTFLNHYNNESNIISADNFDFPEFFIINMLKKHDDYSKIVEFMKLADDNIIALDIDEREKDKPRLIIKYKEFDLSYSDISAATQKLLYIAYSIYDINNKNGISLIDELDNSLNYEIAKFILYVFSEKVCNMSQIIFTSNNPELMNELRRDQIYLLLKNDYNIHAVNFYDFIDFNTNKRVRKDFSFTKAYKKNIIDNFPNEIIKNNIIDDLNK